MKAIRVQTESEVRVSRLVGWSVNVGAKVITTCKIRYVGRDNKEAVLGPGAAGVVTAVDFRHSEGLSVSVEVNTHDKIAVKKVFYSGDGKDIFAFLPANPADRATLANNLNFGGRGEKNPPFAGGGSSAW